jgi:hypothetical protein
MARIRGAIEVGEFGRFSAGFLAGPEGRVVSTDSTAGARV